MSTAEKYECTLDKASIKKAAKELNEDPNERDSAVASFRQWIEQNSSWLKTPTDTRFLLGFLRNAKFAQLAARKRLVNFWTARTNNKEWFANVDTKDEKIEACLRMGAFLVMPKRDKEGRLVIMGRTASMDVSGKYSVDDLMKGLSPVIDYCLMDENVQVNGFVMVEDMSDLTFKHQTFFGVEPMKRSMSVWIKGYPARYKSMHYYNTNPVFEAMFAIFSPLFPDKLRKRLHFHGKKLSDLYPYVDKSCLPTEYLPDDYKGENPGTIQDCVEDVVRKLQSPEVNSYILRLSSDEYGVVEELKPSDDELFTESFRKLNVD